jgi:hypothetical protein
MRAIAFVLAGLALGGCGDLVIDGTYRAPVPRLLHLDVHVAPVPSGPTLFGLLWKTGGSYVVTALHASSSGNHTLDVYDEMPGYDALGVAFLAAFSTTVDSLNAIRIQGSTFVDDVTLIGVDTAQVLLFARAPMPRTGSPADVIVVANGPLDPGYHLANVRCGPDGKPESPMPIEPVSNLTQGDLDARFEVTASNGVADASRAVHGIPTGAIGDSCLVLPQ